MGIAGDVTPLLHVLAPLGVPQEAPPEHCKVLACVSMAPGTYGDGKVVVIVGGTWVVEGKNIEETMGGFLSFSAIH